MSRLLTASLTITLLAGAAAPAVAAVQNPSLNVVPAAAFAAPRPLEVDDVTFAAVPFAVGEELVYRASFGGISAGTARMRVEGIEMVRGRPAYHLVFSIDGGIPLFRVRDRYESWIDVETLASLRHRQNISEGRYKRTTTYEIYPERAQYRKNDGPMERSVSDPLDDGSFIYAVRAAGVRPGETRRDDRYFRPDRNPVVIAGIGRETVRTDAGTFATTVVKPSIKTSGLFSEGGDARIYFSDDAHRIPVLVKTKFSRFSLTLSLDRVTKGDPESHGRLLAEALSRD